MESSDSMELFDDQLLSEEPAYPYAYEAVYERVYFNPKEGREIIVVRPHMGEAGFVLKRFSTTLTRGWEKTYREAYAEFHAMQHCSHPNVLQCYEFRECGPNSCEIVLEYAEGTLTQACSQMTLPEKKEAIRQVCSALSHIHSRGYVHGDIKCDNILMVNGVAKIADFGTAIPIETDFSVYKLRGTANYMAPEVIRQGICKPSSDIWSFGAVIYHLAHHRPPYMGLEENAIIFRIGSDQSIDLVNSDIGEFFVCLILLCTYSEEQDRPTAQDLLPLM